MASLLRSCFEGFLMKMRSSCLFLGLKESRFIWSFLNHQKTFRWVRTKANFQAILQYPKKNSRATLGYTKKASTSLIRGNVNVKWCQDDNSRRFCLQWAKLGKNWTWAQFKKAFEIDPSHIGKYFHRSVSEINFFEETGKIIYTTRLRDYFICYFTSVKRNKFSFFLKYKHKRGCKVFHIRQLNFMLFGGLSKIDENHIVVNPFTLKKRRMLSGRGPVKESKYLPKNKVILIAFHFELCLVDLRKGAFLFTSTFGNHDLENILDFPRKCPTLNEVEKQNPFETRFWISVPHKKQLKVIVVSGVGGDFSLRKNILEKRQLCRQAIRK